MVCLCAFQYCVMAIWKTTADWGTKEGETKEKRPIDYQRRAFAWERDVKWGDWFTQLDAFIRCYPGLLTINCDQQFFLWCFSPTLLAFVPFVTGQTRGVSSQTLPQTLWKLHWLSFWSSFALFCSAMLECWKRSFLVLCLFYYKPLCLKSSLSWTTIRRLNLMRFWCLSPNSDVVTLQSMFVLEYVVLTTRKKE